MAKANRVATCRAVTRQEAPATDATPEEKPGRC